MSIRGKVPLIILAYFLLNILFVGLYYHMVLSHEIAAKYRENTAALEQAAADVAARLSAGLDYSGLDALTESEDYLFEVRSLGGDTLYRTGREAGVTLDLVTTAAFSRDGETLLLRMVRPMSLGFMSSFNFVTNLFVAEFFIIAVMLLLLAALMHINMVRPLVALQKIMRQYKQGARPRSTRRLDEIGQLQNGFRELTDSLDEERQAQWRIIASISHDIKTPLTSVMGYAEQLQKENLPADRTEKYLRTIYQKSCAIKELVEEFDDYLSLQLQPVLKKQRITAGALCRMLEEDFMDELSGIGIELSMECACPDCVLEADLSKLARVFGNIVANSIRYAEGGRIRIECGPAPENRVAFLISDNGSGVMEEDLARIFEPFYTSDRSRRVAGLGLSICRSIVERHGGRIFAHNNEQGGLTVGFELPGVSA